MTKIGSVGVQTAQRLFEKTDTKPRSMTTSSKSIPDAPSRPDSRPRSKSLNGPVDTKALHQGEVGNDDFGGMTMSDLSGFMQDINLAFNENQGFHTDWTPGSEDLGHVGSDDEFGEESHITDDKSSGTASHEQIANHLKQIDKEIGFETDVAAFKSNGDASHDQIAKNLKEIDSEFGFTGELADAPTKEDLQPPLVPFSRTRYESDTWKGKFANQNEAKRTDNEPFLNNILSGDMPKLEGGRYLDLTYGHDEPRPQDKSEGSLLQKVKSKLSSIADTITAAAKRFVLHFSSDEKKLNHKLAEFSKQVDAFHAGGSKPEWKGPAHALDRVDAIIVGDKSKVDIHDGNAIGVFGGHYEGEVHMAGGVRSPKLAEISNHMTKMLSDLKADCKDAKKNPAKLDEKTYISTAIKVMVGSASMTDFQALELDSLMELSGAFTMAGQHDKASFVEEMVNVLEGLASVTDVALIETAKTRILDEADAVFAGGPSNLKADTTGLADLFDGSPEQISNNLTKVLQDLRQQANEPHRNLFELSDTQYRQAGLVQIMQKATAIEVRNADLGKLETALGYFIGRNQTEKAQTVSELIDLVKLARSEGGARQLFMNNAEKELLTADSPVTFLRLTGDVGVSAIKKIVDSTDASQYSAEIKTLMLRFNERESVKRVDKIFNDADIKTMSRAEITPEMAREIGDLATELMQELAKIPVPEGLRSVLGEFSEILSSRDDEVDGYVHKLFADQIFLKLASPIMTTSDAGTGLKLAANLIQVVANGVKDQDKWSQNGREMYRTFSPQIRNSIDNYLVANGMPDSARGF